jgi:hypothetical protein
VRNNQLAGSFLALVFALCSPAYGSDHYCPGDGFWIPGNHLTGRGLEGGFAFPDLNYFRSDVAKTGPPRLVPITDNEG